MNMRSKKPSVLRGVVSGIAAGIAATLVMDQFQKLSTVGQKEIEKRKKRAEHESPWQIAREQAQEERKEAQQERVHRDCGAEDRQSCRNSSSKRTKEEGRAGCALHLRDIDGRSLCGFCRTASRGHYGCRYGIRNHIVYRRRRDRRSCFPAFFLADGYSALRSVAALGRPYRVRRDARTRAQPDASDTVTFAANCPNHPSAIACCMESYSV